MSAQNTPKSTLWEAAWQLLKRGKADRKHPFYTPIFCTVSPTLHPRSRTIVLRNVLRRQAQLWCYTDLRSQKAKDVAHNPSVSWTFWAPKPQIQINVSGVAYWLEADKAGQLFQNMPQHSRKAYATLSPPGQPQAIPEDGLPNDWDSRELLQTNYAAENFGVLITTMKNMEVLKLSRDGHQRLLGTKKHEQSWKLDWLIP